MKKAFGVILTIVFLSCPAWGDAIVFSGTDDIGAFGFGHDPRDLTIQSHGPSNNSESGCIAPDGMGNLLEGTTACGGSLGPALDTATGGDEDNPLGHPKQAAPTLSSLGPLTDIGIVFDGVQPQNSDNPFVTINDLTLKVYSGATLVYDVSLVPTDLTLPTNPGNGNSDYLFTLDPAAMADLESAVYGLSNVTLALDSTISFPNQSAGPDSFLIVGITPEPSSLLLVGTGLIGIVSLLRRRRTIQN